MTLTFDFRVSVIALIGCLAIVATAGANNNLEDASLMPQGLKGASIHSTLLLAALAQDCTVVIKPFMITGTVQAIYLPEGVEITAQTINDRSLSRLEYDLVRQQDTNDWSLTVSLPSCGPDAVSKVALWCNECKSPSDASIQSTLIATAPVQGATTTQSGPTVVLLLQESTIISDLESIKLLDSPQDSVLSSENLQNRHLLQNIGTKDGPEEVEEGDAGAGEENYPTIINPALSTSSPSVEPVVTSSPGITTSPTPTPTTSSSSSPAVTAAAGVPASNTTSASPAPSACSLTVANEVQSYTMCYSLRIGTSFKIYYTLDADPLDATSSILSMGMQGTSSGWIAVGFPSKSGRMTNAGAAILKACSTCSSGAAIDQYYMTGTSEVDVNPDTRFDMTAMKASASGGVLSGSWKMKLPGIAATANRRLLQLNFPASSFPLIYASGPISATGALLEHKLSQSSSGSVDLLQGVPGASNGSTGGDSSTGNGNAGDGSAPEEEASAQTESITKAHMWMATISWGFIIPIAILMSRYFKPHTTYWFTIHRALASLGYLMAVVTLVLGFEANGGWETDKPVHRDLGLACTVLGLVQMFSLINWLRPTKDHKLRPYWFFVHSWLGRSAAILGIANIYYGIIYIEELGTWAWASYTGVLGLIVLVAVVMEVVNWRMHKKVKNENEWKMMQAPSRPALSKLVK